MEFANSTVAGVVADLRRRLQRAGIESADQEAVWLVAHAVGISVLQQTVDPERVLTEGEQAAIGALAAKRTQRIPLQYLLGSQEFCGLEFAVTPSVLIPRPETELLVGESLRRLSGRPRPVIVEVGTGSGCVALALALALPHANIMASDRSAAALAVARQNAVRLGGDEVITWLEGDLLAPVAGHGLEGQVDVIVSNPPYIAESEWSSLQPEVRLYEPRTALVAGSRGTELHERLLADAVPFLRPGGSLILEIGHMQGEFLRKLAGAMPDYGRVEVLQDHAGIGRVLIVKGVG
jgi:release factor glutamine methyltransferase